MREIPRRHALHIAGIGFGIAVGGCIADPDTGPGNGGSDGNGDEHEPGAGDDTPWDRTPFRASQSVPNWHLRDKSATGHIVVIDSEERARAALPMDELKRDRRDTVAEFVDDTDFEGFVLLFVESAGPDGCYTEIEVDELAVEDGTVTGRVRASDPSNGDRVCTQAVTYPSVLLRIADENGPASKARLTVIDGWGNDGQVTAAASDPLAPALDNLEGYVRPEGDPVAIPSPLECDGESFDRLGAGYREETVRWGETESDDGDPTFALRVDSLDVEYGETVAIRLTNVSDELQYTGNRAKYNIEILTEAGWEEIRGIVGEQRLGYTDEAIGHRPGRGFEWRFTMTEEELIGDSFEEILEVCPGLHSGRYRFVFWEPAVAVAFDVSIE